MKTACLVGFTLVGVVLAAVTVGHAQADRRAIGTLFIDARDAPRQVTISKNGARLATVTLPRGTVLSAVDERRRPTHVGDGRFEFHGAFELRAMTAADSQALIPSSGGMPAAELMTHAPLVLSAQGVDVVVEPSAEP